MFKVFIVYVILTVSVLWVLYESLSNMDSNLINISLTINTSGNNKGGN